MIEINLLPGAARKAKRGTGFSLKAVAATAAARIRDPYLIGAVASVGVAAAVVGLMHLSQASTSADLEVRELTAVRDSTRYALVLGERRKAEAKRDSVVKQLNVIRSIDNDRYIWSHILDEVSRSLPPYTWLKSVSQTSRPVVPAAADSATKKDPERQTDPLTFNVVGHTVDIQALTRFMKLLETSPFVQNVQLAKSEMVMLDGREVTQFQLNAAYERPDKSVITTAPVSLSVR